MSKPNAYTVQVSEHISDDPASDVVKSNIITITVVPSPAELTTPAPGSTLASSTVTFAWNANTGSSAYKLILGTTAGGSDLYNSYTTTATSVTANKLPTNDATIYARLCSEINSVWQYNDYSYTAQ